VAAAAAASAAVAQAAQCEIRSKSNELVASSLYHCACVNWNTLPVCQQCQANDTEDGAAPASNDGVAAIRYTVTVYRIYGIAWMCNLIRSITH
jgi:hypothetical protein